MIDARTGCCNLGFGWELKPTDWFPLRTGNVVEIPTIGYATSVT